MADPLAILGAATGTAGFVLAARREVLLTRARLGIEHGIYLHVDSGGSGEVQDAWLVIKVWNQGGREITLERVGLRFVYSRQEGEKLHLYKYSLVEMLLTGSSLQLRQGGPADRLYTPLGPLLATGIDPLNDPVWAWAKDVGGRQWKGLQYPIIEMLPPNTTPAQLAEKVSALTAESEPLQGGPMHFTARLATPNDAFQT